MSVQHNSTLASLAAVANHEHIAGVVATRKGLSHYCAAGMALLEAKRRLGHGQFRAWVEANVCFSYRTARAYMLLARHGEKWQHAASLRDALDLISNGEGSRMAARERKEETAAHRAKLAKLASNADSPHATIRQGDFRQVLGDLPDGSVDLVFTDPPYTTADLTIYSDLGALAARVLKIDGSLVCYAPTYNLGEVLERVQPHLRFWSTITIKHNGHHSRLSYYRIMVCAKLLLWFVKGRYRGEWVMNLIDGDPPDKCAHDDQQGEDEASYCIEHMCPPGGLVLDPMCGSGTTLIAALKLRRQAMGCEIDAQRARVATSRVNDCS